MKRFYVWAFLVFSILHGARAYDLFDKDQPIQSGLNVFEVSDVFTDIYKKLNDISWAGKNINIAIESLESIHPDAHIAATDSRVILVWQDTIVANYPRPMADDFNGFGVITTALVLKLRELNPEFGKLSEQQMYKSVVDALMRSIDENGKYIFSTDTSGRDDDRILTSIGIQGAQDERRNFRVSAVFKDSPADNHGIVAGDLISKINGVETQKMNNQEIESAFSGFNSGTIKLTVLTPNGENKVVLRRAAVMSVDADIIYKKIQSDKNIENGALLEIVIHKITDSAVAIVAEAISKHPDISGIVLDLRVADGYDERAAAKLAGLFIGQNPVMRIVENEKSESEIIPSGSNVIDIPVIVLISNNTTGTAEAIAAAFYETRMGILIGTPTAGKARLATNIDLNNGGQLVVFNKAVKTGRGSDIQGRGIFPIVCLSNIKNESQAGAFFVNVLNDDFEITDFNTQSDIDPNDIRRACPVISNGSAEDLLSAGVSAKILTDKKIYAKLIGG